MTTPERISNIPQTSPETFSRRLRRAAADVLVYGSGIVLPTVGIAIFAPNEIRSYYSPELIEMTNLLRDNLSLVTVAYAGIVATVFGSALVLDRD